MWRGTCVCVYIYIIWDLFLKEFGKKNSNNYLWLVGFVLGHINPCVRGVMVIIAGIGHGDTSSYPGLIAFHIALIPLGKV